jgi:hypothetical protein
MNGRVEILAFFLPKGDWIEKNELLKTGDKTQSADGIVRIDLSPGNSQEDPRIYQSKYQNSPGLPDIMAQLPGIPEHLPDKRGPFGGPWNSYKSIRIRTPMRIDFILKTTIRTSHRTQVKIN